MAQLISVRMQRSDNSPWGFRLQGGKDFGTPLVIQKVNGNSIAERAGLQAGDAVLRVNSTDVFNLRHKDAQDAIVRAGQSFEITVQRGQTTWKPSVTPTGPLPQPAAHLNNVSPVTRTSLAASKPVSAPIGTGHNSAAKPFLNGNSDNHMKLVNKQFNSPIGLYSEESIAETLSAQTEVLSTGVLGVNFKKNEKTYNAANSEVLKMLQEAENDPREPEPETESSGVISAPAPTNVAGLRHVSAPVSAPPSQTSPNKPLAPAVSARSEFYSHASHAIGGRATSPRPRTPQQAPARAPVANNETTSAPGGLTPPPSHRPSLPITHETPQCSECERVIVGVFVRIKDKNLHVECFKCATCGSSLKNVGYYNINNKLYCDIHAKLAARNNPPAPNLVPVTVPPGGRAPAGAISAALASHSLPSGGPLSPASNHSSHAPYSTPSIDVVDACIKPSHSYEELKCVPPLKSENVTKFANTLAPNGEAMENGNGNHYTNGKVYLSEAKIGVNGNGIDTEMAKLEVSIKPGSSVLSGPKPFSYGTAPISPVTPVPGPYSNHAATLPRTNSVPQNQSETDLIEESTCVIESQQSVQESSVESSEIPKPTHIWPPPKQSEDVPTASPLYIPPGPSNPVLLKSFHSSSSSHEQFYTSESKTEQHEYSQQIIENEEKQENISEVSQVSHEEFAETMAQASSGTWKSVSAPLSEATAEESAEGGAGQKCPRMSICSTEVTNITGRRSVMECIDTISESIDTKMLVDTIKQQIRPPSPPPGPENSKHEQVPVKEEIKPTPPEQPPEEKRRESVTKKSEAIEQQVIQEITNVIKQVDTVQKQLEEVAKQVDTVNKQLEHVQVEEKIPPPKVCPKSGQVCPETCATICQSEQTTVEQTQVCTQIEQLTNQPCPMVCPRKISQPEVAPLPEQTCPMVCPRKVSQPEVAPLPEQTCPMICPRKVSHPEVPSLPEQTCPMVCPRKVSHPEVPSLPEQTCPMVCPRKISQPEVGPEMPQKYESSVIVNSVPKEWKSQFVSALTTASPTPFPQSEFSHEVEGAFPHATAKPTPSYLTNALTIAPDRTFTPVAPTNEPVPLPEETVPYFPPEHPMKPIPREPEKFDPKTPLLDALTTAPTRPFTPIDKGMVNLEDELMKDLPQPPYDENVSMLSALTTAPERPFTPVWNAASIPEPPPMPQSSSVPRRTSLKSNVSFTPQVPAAIADTIQAPKFPPNVPAPKPFPPVSQELKSAFKPTTEFSPSKVVSKQIVQSAELSSVEHVEKVQEVKSVQSVQSSQLVQKSEVYESVVSEGKQSEVCQRQVYPQPKPTQPAYYGLHKPSTIPAYQKHLSPLGPKRSTPLPTGELTEHSEVVSSEYTQEAQGRAITIGILKQPPQKEPSPPPPQPTEEAKVMLTGPPGMPEALLFTNPDNQRSIQTVQPGQHIAHDKMFQPVCEGIARCTTPSSRPARAVTPSLINSPAPVIPYYQMNLIATEHLAPETNLYDPKSPDISRAPTPKLDRKSPMLRAKSPIGRAKSPGPAGPPPSPLRIHAPRIKDTPTAGFGHMIKPRSSAGFQEQFAKSAAKFQSTSDSQSLKKHVKFQEQGLNQQTAVQQSFSETVKAQNLNVQAAATSQQHMVETSSDGLVQVQRKKTVVEECERSRKVIDIERAKSSTVTSVHSTNGSIIGNTKAPISPLVQVQSARGLKTYETSSGKPVPVSNVPTFPTQSSDGQIKPKSITGVPTPFAQSCPLPQPKPQKIEPQPMQPIDNRPKVGVPVSFGGPVGGARSASAFSSVPQKSTAPLPPQSQAPPVQPQTACQNASVSVPNLPGSSASSIPPTNMPLPNAGGVASTPARPLGSVGAAPGGNKGKQVGAVGIAPKRGRGILNKAIAPGARVPLCALCNGYIRGPFITALGKIWCPEHFVCATQQCRRPLQDIGFVEERGLLYCEHCFEQYLAPTCDQCRSKIKGDCLNAIGKHFHPECFNCSYCGKLFGNSPFFLEDGLPYCEADWNELFTTKCFACGFPVEAGDRWVEALNNNYHSQCFNCTMCKKNLEGQSFYAKGGRPFCKNHAR